MLQLMPGGPGESCLEKVKTVRYHRVPVDGPLEPVVV
jgi:hypothetical protein